MNKEVVNILDSIYVSSTKGGKGFIAFWCWTEIGTPIFHASSLLYICTTPLSSLLAVSLSINLFNVSNVPSAGSYYYVVFSFPFSLSFWGLLQQCYRSLVIASFFFWKFYFLFQNFWKKKSYIEFCLDTKASGLYGSFLLFDFQSPSSFFMLNILK